MLIIIAVVVGAFVGGAWGDGFGAAAGALLGWLWVRSHRQERQIAALQRSVQDLNTGRPVAALQPASPALPAADGTMADAGPQPLAGDPAPALVGSLDERGAVIDAADRAAAPALNVPASSREASLWDTAPGELPAAAGTSAAPATAAAASTAAAPATAAAASAPPAARTPGFLDALKGWLFGGNTIVKAGVGILFLGLAFLAKYASEHVQVPVEFRLAAIAGVALALLGLGWRLRQSRAGYAQVLQGGAVAVLYLTLFVAFRFYGVLSIGPVFGLMVLVAALAAALAVLQDARSLAVIGALGGFATPLLVSSGGGNPMVLFAYYLVLDLGIAAVAWHKTWRSLNLIGFVFTFVVGTTWGLAGYRDEHYLGSQLFLIAYFLLFNAILLMPARRLAAAPQTGLAQRADGWVNGSLLFGLPTITFALQHGLVRHWPYGTALSALVMAAFYVLMARAMRSRPQLAVTFDASLAIAIVFLTLVIPFALDSRSTSGAWALEGAGLVWLGFRQSRGLPRIFGYALLVLAGGSMLWSIDQHPTPTAVFNAWLFNGLMLAGASLAAARFVGRANVGPSAPPPGALARAEPFAEPLLIGWAVVWALVTAGVQIDAFVVHPFALAAWLVVFSAIALLCAALSARLDWPRIAFGALLHTPMLVIGVMASAAELDSPAAGGGWWAWPLALAAQGVVLWRAAPRWPAPLQRLVHALGALVVAALGALQGRAVTDTWGDAYSAWPWLGWLVVPALLLMGLPRKRMLSQWPVSAAPWAYQFAAGAVLSFGLLAWTVLANLMSNGAARPLPYVPLLNPLDLGIAAALFAAWLWLHSDATRNRLPQRAALTSAVMAGTGFVWLNAMLIRAFHHFGGVPFRIDAWVNSLAVQTGITLLWTVTALVLMWASARRRLRLPWMAGAALLAAVVLKLLLVDLAGTGTVMRIVSFIGVGVLMLVIGFVAPLPTTGAGPPNEGKPFAPG